MSRAAVAIARNDADRVTSLSNLAGVLKISFGIDPTADTAAELLQVSREAAHSVNNPMYLANLSGALTLVSSWNGDKALLPEAVDAAFAAVDATPQDHPSRERRTSVLADTLTGLLEQEAEPDPRRRVLLVRRALSIFPEGTPLYSALLADLSLGLQAVYLRYGERSALLEAIEVSRRAYAEPDHDDENWRGSLVTLTWALGTEFASTGDVSVLREAIEIGREACLVNNSGGTNSVLARCNLSDALLTMYQQTGETELLHEAIDRAREGSAMPPPDGERASGPHSALSAALLIHFQRTGDDQSLQEAIESGRRAVELVEGQEKVALLSNLGIVLHTAYEHRSDTTMLREAVSVCRSAVELAAPEHPNYANYLTNLGGSLGELASLENDEAGLIEALKLCRAASAVAPASHANHLRYLTNQSNALSDLFSFTGDDSHLHEALRLRRHVRDSTPADNPDHAARQVNMGVSLDSLFELTEDATHLDEARRCYAAAAVTNAAPLRHRLQAARLATRRDLAAGDPHHAVEMAELTVSLVPLLTTRERSSVDRRRQVLDFSGLPDLVAAAAIAAGRPARAVELLEQTRGLLFADALDIRSDLTSLRDQEPLLAEEFRALGREIEQADLIQTSAAQRIELHERWENLLGRIHRVDGFAGFLRPPSIEEITRQTAQGPVVYVTVYGTSGHALVVTDTVTAVPLGDLTSDWAYREANVLRAAVAKALDAKLALTRETAQQEILAALERLWHTVTEPVLRHLGHTGRPVTWPRIWWCPVGIMTFLPLHAAGNHNAGAAADTVMDRVISSYIPTVRALAHARTDLVEEPAPLDVDRRRARTARLHSTSRRRGRGRAPARSHPGRHAAARCRTRGHSRPPAHARDRALRVSRVRRLGGPQPQPPDPARPRHASADRGRPRPPPPAQRPVRLPVRVQHGRHESGARRRSHPSDRSVPPRGLPHGDRDTVARR